jgi:hypothetical protein
MAHSPRALRYTVREGPHGNYVPDLTMVNVDSLDEVIELLGLADQNRSTAKTNMNEHSSRSHLILSCYIVSTNKHSGEVSRYARGRVARGEGHGAYRGSPRGRGLGCPHPPAVARSFPLLHASRGAFC